MRGWLVARSTGILPGRVSAACRWRTRGAARFRLLDRLKACDSDIWKGAQTADLPPHAGADAVSCTQVRAPVLSCAASDDCSTVLGIVGPGWIARWETIAAGAAVEMAEDGDE